MIIFSIFRDNFITSLLIIIILILILYFLIKFGFPVKSKKKNISKEKKVAEKPKDELVVKKEGDTKKTEETKNVEPVFVKEEETKSQQAEEKFDYSKKEEDFNQKYEFEQISKGISKIKLRHDKKELNQNLLTDKDGDLLNYDDNNNLDRKIRLYDAIKNNNFDDLFASHLSNKVEDIDSNSHLRPNNYLFERTNDMIKNSMRQFEDDENQNISEIENERRENLMQNILDEIDEVDEDSDMVQNKYIDVKTMIISEMLLNRKNSKND